MDLASRVIQVVSDTTPGVDPIDRSVTFVTGAATPISVPATRRSVAGTVVVIAENEGKVDPNAPLAQATVTVTTRPDANTSSQAVASGPLTATVTSATAGDGGAGRYVSITDTSTSPRTANRLPAVYVS